MALNSQFNSKRITFLSELRSVDNHLPRRHAGHGVIGFLSTFLRDLGASVVNFHSYGWAAGSCDTQEIVFFARTMLMALAARRSRVSSCLAPLIHCANSLR